MNSSAAPTTLIVAADLEDLSQAHRLVRHLGDSVQWYKVGSQLFTLHGPDAVRLFKDHDKKVFLDLKFHDIPNTVAAAVRAAAQAGADMTNVHAHGGRAMLTAAADAARDTGMILLAVTVLTSLDRDELDQVGIAAAPGDQVQRLARLTADAGLHGVVCSAHEIGIVRAACGPGFQLVVPGIRPAGSRRGDQKRVMTPEQAARAGATYIVVGRPVTQADDPAAAARGIQKELRQASGAVPPQS